MPLFWAEEMADVDDGVEVVVAEDVDGDVVEIVEEVDDEVMASFVRLK